MFRAFFRSIICHYLDLYIWNYTPLEMSIPIGITGDQLIAHQTSRQYGPVGFKRAPQSSTHYVQSRKYISNGRV